MNHHRTILGVSSTASREEIDQAYKDLVKVWHPDRFMHDPKLQSKAQEKLKEINLAYKFLKKSESNFESATQSNFYKKAEYSASKAPTASLKDFLGWIDLAVPLIAGILIWNVFHSDFLPQKEMNVPFAREYFSMGDTKDIVRDFQGPPDRILTNSLGRGETWVYNNHSILFDRHGRVNGLSAKEI